jgi:hypothetical protein
MTVMLNKLPTNTPLPNILRFLDTSKRWSERNRALFAVRQVLRIKDIACLRVSDVLNQDATITQFVVSRIDGTRFEIDLDLRVEIDRYLRYLFSVPSSKSLVDILTTDTNIPLFATQKKACFSSNTLAQHYSYQDRLVHGHFESHTAKSKCAGHLNY